MSTKQAEPPTIKAVIERWIAAGVEEFVYVIEAGEGGPVKIGRAIDPEGRAIALQCGNPYPLRVRAVIPGGSAIERRLHLRFHESNMEGEWFSLSAVILAYVQGIGDKALAFYEDRTVPPVDYLIDWVPISALDRELLWDAYRGSLTEGRYYKDQRRLPMVSGETIAEFRRQLVAA